ncbi:MAG: zinc ABC transporter permease [Firmicutes bacterium ZCTH02-B6]|nr:MAG: zinc ABC transporter permease [Firmicutes bacterium ZCTH02-B6]
MLAALLDNVDLVIMAIGALVGIAASLLGTFLVLRRSSLYSDAISHSVLLGIVLVYLMSGDVHSPYQLVGAALAGLATVYLSELLGASRRVKQDAAIGLVFPALFALAVLLINLYARDVHLDEHAVLLGELAFAWLDVVPIGGLEIPRSLLTMSAITLVNALFVTLFYKELKLAVFDEGLAHALGLKPRLLFYILLLLTSVTAVGAFDAVGAILFITFVIVPPATAYLLTDRLWLVLVGSAAIAVLASVTGFALAMRFDVSIGGMMATVTGFFLAVAFVAGPRYGLVARWLRLRQQRAQAHVRMLLVHLLSHEYDEEAALENVPAALEHHLRWPPRLSQAVVAAAQAQGLVTLSTRDQRLHLTEAGRDMAREVLEPWRRH